MLTVQQMLDADWLVHGDNLHVMTSLPPASFDFIYLDPPFFTGRVQALARTAFSDTWPEGLAGYLSWLEPRLKAARRLLAPTGNLVVHLDWHAVHYAKVMLDTICGYDRFVNELVWCYSIGGKSSRHFGRKHDTLLWYSAGPDYVFNGAAVAIPRKPRTHMKMGTDETGRRYQEKRDARSGRIYRYYEDAGKIPEDWWTDIETLNREDRERIGYPTQKPLALLKRLVQALSPPSGRVGDFVCGSGTTLAAAAGLGRSFVGCDASEASIEACMARLEGAPRPLRQLQATTQEMVAGW